MDTRFHLSTFMHYTPVVDNARAILFKWNYILVAEIGINFEHIYVVSFHVKYLNDNYFIKKDSHNFSFRHCSTRVQWIEK